MVPGGRCKIKRDSAPLFEAGESGMYLNVEYKEPAERERSSSESGVVVIDRTRSFGSLRKDRMGYRTSLNLQWYIYTV